MFVEEVKIKIPRDFYEAFREEIVLILPSTETLNQLTKVKCLAERFIIT